MEVMVLGAGCASCHALEQRVEAVLAELGIDESVDMVTDYARIAGYGVMSTPALVVDGTVLISGRVPTEAELTAVLTDAMR